MYKVSPHYPLLQVWETARNTVEGRADHSSVVTGRVGLVSEAGFATVYVEDTKTD